MALKRRIRKQTVAASILPRRNDLKCMSEQQAAFGMLTADILTIYEEVACFGEKMSVL